MSKPQDLTPQQTTQLLKTLQARFEKNKTRHPHILWSDIEKKLLENRHKLWAVYQMEETGGEPDVVELDTTTDQYIFIDCSAETPKGRRSLCYDSEGQESRKEFKPANNAIDMAANMGIELLNETEYRQLQMVGNFDTKTSSWIVTPSEIRKLGGALFADFRYNTVFIYHNSAPSYYAVRGFRGLVRV